MSKHPVEWQLIEIHFKRDLDPAELFAALAPPADVEENGSLAMQSEPDSLSKRFRTWGWGTDIGWGNPPREAPSALGVYWDFTFVEDDERFMPLIAPFVEANSRAIFEVSRRPGAVDVYGCAFEGWDFDGDVVTRRRVERNVEWDWV